MQHGLWKLVIRYVLYTYLHRDPVIQMLFRAVVGGCFPRVHCEACCVSPAYDNLQSRKEVREAAWARPGWDECVAYTGKITQSTTPYRLQLNKAITLRGAANQSDCLLTVNWNDSISQIK